MTWFRKYGILCTFNLLQGRTRKRLCQYQKLKTPRFNKHLSSQPSILMNKVIPDKNQENIFHLVILQLLSYNVILYGNWYHINYIFITYFSTRFRIWNVFSLSCTDVCKIQHSLEAQKPNEIGQMASFRPSLWTQTSYNHSLQLQQMQLTF